MNSHPLTTRLLLFLAAALLFTTNEAKLHAAAPEKTDNSVAGDTKTGSIEGRVLYKADPKRRWRYSRYYIKNRKTGELAEAVVVVTGASLKNHFPPQKEKTAIVDQKDFRFIPETVAIRAGDRVKFLNSDGATHNVFAFHIETILFCLSGGSAPGTSLALLIGAL